MKGKGSAVEFLKDDQFPRYKAVVVNVSVLLLSITEDERPTYCVCENKVEIVKRGLQRV